MRILIVNHQFPPYSPSGGGAVGLLRDSKALLDSHNQVTVIAGHSNKPYRENLDGLDVIRVSFPDIPPRAFWFQVMNSDLILQHSRHSDVVYTYNASMSLLIGRLCTMGVPVVTKIPGVTLDNAFAYLKLPLSSWDAREAIGHLGLQPIYASLTWLDLRNSTRLVFDSNHSMRSAERYYRIRFRDRSNVARNFVSIDQTKDVNNTPTNQIIFVGRLIALKGVLDLIIAFSILSGKPEFAKWKLLLIGDGPLRAKVEHKIDQLDLRRNVYVLGQVDFSEVLRRERESHLLVHPSYVESNSVALAEAMAIGLPVVVPYEPWAVEQTQNYHSKAYFTLGDASDMARAIEAATKMRVQTSLPQAKGDKGHLLNEILSEAVREMTIKLAR